MRSPRPLPPATGTLKKSPSGLRLAVIVITLLAVVVRLLIIAHSHGGSNLAIYTYFSRLALHGANPFNPPLHGAINPVHSNSPPLEVAVFTALLAVHNSPTTLRLLFVLGDVAVLLLVGLCFPRPRRWRLAFMLFYAFNPFVLLAWTAYAQDKTLLFFGIAVLLLSLERGRVWVAWLALTALAAFKFLGAFAVPALAVHSFRKRRWWALAPVAAFLVLLALSNLPWFPKSLDAFSRRDALLAIDPGFAEIVRVWERRLGELNVMVEAVDPPPEVWRRIKAELDLRADRGQAPAHGSDHRRPVVVLRAPDRHPRSGRVVAVRRVRIPTRRRL